jgi:hypothetical protein
VTTPSTEAAFCPQQLFGCIFFGTGGRRGQD